MNNNRYTHICRDVHVRSGENGEESRTIEGYAIVFGQESETLWSEGEARCVEVIAPEAISLDLLNRSDIKLTLYHDMGRLLARSKKGEGSLSYGIDDHGVHFSAEMPRTQWGDEALELVRRGDIDGCSFMFRTDYGKKANVQRSASEDGKKVVYTVRKIQGIYDFTLTPDPAYPQTECEARAKAWEEHTNTEDDMTEKEIRDGYQVAEAKVEAINEAAKAEKRELSEEELSQIRDLNETMNTLKQEIENFKNTQMEEKRNITLAAADDELRRAKTGKYDVSVVLTRDIMTTQATADTGIIPVSEKEVMDPLVEGLIWGQLGIPVQTGLAGELRWPFYTKAVASWEDETSRLVDRGIDYSALTMAGNRLGLAIPVSRTAIEDSRSNIVENTVMKAMPLAVQELINDAMLTIYGEYKEGSEIKEKKVAGPFAQYANNASKNCAVVDFGASITRKDLLKMKAAVASTGVAMKAPCYVVSENTKAELEDTKVDAGSGRFVCENDRILGYPVLTSNNVPDGIVLFGDWSYQAAGFFGQTSMVIDPYTLARQFSTDFVLNMRFGTARLRKEAFVLGRTTAAKTAMTTALTALTKED